MKADMLERTEKLLGAVENGVLTDLKEEEAELRAEAANVKTQAMGDAEREAQVKAQDEAMREKARDLAAKIDRWATSGEDFLNQLDSQELNEAMSEARTIAKYFGLDVKKLGDLYELGKQAIKNHEFILPNAVPPDKNENYSAYFESFFVFAHKRELELSEYREKQQQWRVTLFKRVTLAYIRALLEATEPVPACNKTEPAGTVNVNGQSLSSFGCKDPVVENLRAYVQAVQKIAEADTDRFSAEAEIVLAQQELATDLAAGLPLVGDAMDYYNLYAGEDLAGRCLTRFDKGLTALFAALPFMPSGWATQAVKRMGLENQLANLTLLMTGSVEYGEEMIAGLSKRFGITPEQFAKARDLGLWFEDLAMTEVVTMPSYPKGSKWVQDSAEKLGVPQKNLKDAWENLNKNVTFTGLEGDEIIAMDGVISNQGAKSLSKPVGDDAVLRKNIEQVAEGQKYLRSLLPEMREKARQISRKRLEANLLTHEANRRALAGDSSMVKEMSGMVPDHVDTLMEEAREMQTVVLGRYVNKHSTGKIADGFFTKPMDVKPKSADWGPQAAFLPIDQKFSKLGNPDAPDLKSVEKYSLIAQDCLKQGPCKQTDLVLANGDEVIVWKTAGKERPIVKRGDQYLDHDTGAVLQVDPADTYPMKVVALPDPKTGKLVPVTADYDLLAVGGKGDWETPELSPGAGYATEQERKFGERGNAAIKKKNGYKGNNLIHHGPEAQFVGSTGVYGSDPVVTLLDPDRGSLIIPKCDRACMVQWCETTGQCGSVSVCDADKPKVPCMQIDPERLVKDLFHDKRIDGYTALSPNSAWGWGDYNGLSGWAPKVVLDDKGSLKQSDWMFGQYTMKYGVRQLQSSFLSKFTSRNLKNVALAATEQLFSCPGQEMAGEAQ